MPFKNQHPLYHVWRSMRDRCRNPNFKQFADYGGRGITICDRWNSFAAFVEDMGPRPDGYTLDRIDNDKGYGPDNCRWASHKEQQRNRRVNVYVTVDGVRHLAVALGDINGVKTDTIVARAKAGLCYDKVISPERRFELAGLSLGGAANGARQRSKTHCSNGHEFTEANTYFTKEGWRNCRMCRRKASRID